MCVTYPRARYLSASDANMPTRSDTLPRRTPGIAKDPASHVGGGALNAAGSAANHI